MTEPKNKKSMDEVRTFVKMVAHKQGWILHPDTTFRDTIVEGLMTNFNRYSYFACPCRDADGLREEDKDIICPCDYCVPDQEEFGHCFCGLYLTEEFSRKETLPTSIPERRPF